MEAQDTKLGTEKQFSVPVEQLYQAWITPEDLKQWWHPSENKLTTVELNVQVGGQFKYEFEAKEGQTSLVITGEYKEVIPNQKLVYTWNWDVNNDHVKKSDHQLTIEFQSAGEGSRIHVTQDNYQNSESVTPHEEGWEKALNDLENYLNK